MMKLILISISMLTANLNVYCQRFQNDNFPFPPQFSTPRASAYQSSSSIYLPPESHTTIPYFSMKNMNNLKFPFLPPTGTRVPSFYPTPFPMIMSSTFVPNFDDDDQDDNREGNIKLRISSPKPSHTLLKLNNTNNNLNLQKAERREFRTIPKMVDYQNPIERIDVKFPMQVPNNNNDQVSTSAIPSSTNEPRKINIIPQETHRNDRTIDQIKAGSFSGTQFLHAPLPITFIPTTEPAIPIIRLSNEMDLDGSFSYEALGADQTHYVQHSRMENMGTDKEEQVVEGSYSYVGDNGQTYTVHYIADANGYRAIGDHLPVAPPVPEIIQRAVQYNLAEEAKKPPHLKAWQNDERNNEILNGENSNHPFSLPSTRNLFTGRTPEAFSFSYGSNTQNLLSNNQNLLGSASNQISVKAAPEFTTEQPKAKSNGPISPQITFLASQGAHVPALNSAQQAGARMFPSDKPTMPQLMNYEANSKELEQDNAKALWRWQYGLNANENSNQTPDKNTISRSFGEGDDIVINFSDMTPQQYTNMIRSQLESNVETIQFSSVTPKQANSNIKPISVVGNDFTNYYNSPKNNTPVQKIHNYQPQQNSGSTTYRPPASFKNDMTTESYQIATESNAGKSILTTKKSSQTMISEPLKLQVRKEENLSNRNEQHFMKYNNENKQQGNLFFEKPPQQNLKSSYEKSYFAKQSKMNYDYDYNESEAEKHSNDYGDTSYEPRKIRTDPYERNSDLSNIGFNKSREQEVKLIDYSLETTTQEYLTTASNVKFADFIVSDPTSKPLITTLITPNELMMTVSPSTETSIENIFENNIFLKNFILYDQNKQANNATNEYTTTALPTETIKQIQLKPIAAEPKIDKVPKLIQYQTNTFNEVKNIKKKPLDIADVLNYISLKNHFESNKMKSKSNNVNMQSQFSHNPKSEPKFLPLQKSEIEHKESVISELNQNELRTIQRHQQEELKGVIKNYKVLHRKPNNINHEQNGEYIRTDLTPPKKQSANLPPLGRAGPSMKSYLPPIFVK